MKVKFHTKQQLEWIFWTTFIIIIGMILFKYIPMHLYGEDILYDASNHVVWTCWGLYVAWFFIDQKKSWRIPYFIIAGGIVIVMSIQRIYAQQHNEIGVMLALVIAAIAIIIPRWKEFEKEIKF
jgi:hypothetical protein